MVDHHKTEESVSGVYKEINRDKKILKKRRRKRVVRRFFQFLILLILGLGLYAFDSSNASRVQDIQISRNQFVSDHSVLNTLGLKNGSRLLFKPSFYLEYQSKKIPGVAQAKINVYYTKGLVNIEIIEKKVLFFNNFENPIIHFADMSQMELSDDKHKQIDQIPEFINYDETLITTSYYKNLAKIDSDIMMSISQMELISQPLDPTKTRFKMNNGYIVYANAESLPYLNQYATIIKSMKPEDQCIELSTFGPTPDKVTAITRPCSAQDN